MDTNLQPLWQSNSSLFDGNCLYLGDFVPITNLRLFLLATLNELKPMIINGQLFKFDDWHEHDGYVSTSTLISVREFQETMTSDDVFYASRHGDTYVRWAFYPKDIAFLLRYYILDKDEDSLYPGIWGTCDFAANDQTLEKIRGLADDVLAKVVRMGKAKAYFDRNYAG